MMTNFSSMTYNLFAKEYLPYIDSLDHFKLTLAIYRSNPKHTWEYSANLARK